jgi:hypothetical protein
VDLDPFYEGKCVNFLRDGDLFWLVGIRQTEARMDAPAPRWIVGDSRGIDTLVDEKADLILSCPPYADLEVYSDDPADLSTMEYPAFLEAYDEIIRKTCALLKDDRFVVWVVGDVRDKMGLYRGFPWRTIQSFEAAGLRLYNEGVLVTPVGSLPIRVGRQFEQSRKLGKTHQNVFVFVKGDPKKATQACGPVKIDDSVLAHEGGEVD